MAARARRKWPRERGARAERRKEPKRRAEGRGRGGPGGTCGRAAGTAGRPLSPARRARVPAGRPRLRGPGKPASRSCSSRAARSWRTLPVPGRGTPRPRTPPRESLRTRPGRGRSLRTRVLRAWGTWLPPPWWAVRGTPEGCVTRAWMGESAGGPCVPGRGEKDAPRVGPAVGAGAPTGLHPRLHREGQLYGPDRLNPVMVAALGTFSCEVCLAEAQASLVRQPLWKTCSVEPAWPVPFPLICFHPDLDTQHRRARLVLRNEEYSLYLPACSPCPRWGLLLPLHANLFTLC